MSLIDPSLLSPQDLVAQFIVECRGKGLMLPYQEYGLIDEWLALAEDADALLLVLSDVLPGYFQGPKSGRSLRGVHRLVVSRLRDRAMTHLS